MIELKIDGQNVDIDQKVNIAATHSIADIQEPDGTSAGYSKSVELPFTPTNMRVFRFTQELFSKEQFNNELHAAEYMVDGNTVMSGVAQIEKFTYTTGTNGCIISGNFHVSIIGSSFEWIANARKRMNELQGGMTVTYTLDDVYANSICEDASLIKFFPVDRGAFWEEEDAQGNKITRKKLDLYDYHPFLNVWRMVRLVYGGFNVKSSQQGFFEQIYCSGFMPKNEDLSYIEEDNDFYIGISEIDVGSKGFVSVKNTNIQVYPYNQIESGEYHNENGVINPSPGRGPVAFRPTETTVARMETNLNYVTKIQNGAEVLAEAGECFYVDTFQQFIGENVENIVLGLDKCEEAKNTQQGDAKYPSVPYDPDADHTYVACLKITSDYIEGDSMLFHGTSQAHPWTWLGRYKKGCNWYVVKVERYGRGYFKNGRSDPGDPVFEISEFSYFEINNDEVTFNIVNATKNAYTLHKGMDYSLFGRFSCSHTFTSDPGNASVELLLCLNNNIKPQFLNIIGLGDEVGLKTIGGESSQLEYLGALRQMFNLMFYTNPLTKEVFIEPRTQFYNLERDRVIDWRGKIDYSKEIEVQELGGDVGNSLKLAYTDGGDVVQKHNKRNNIELGAYNAPLQNKTTSEAKEIINPMFSPFLLRNVESVGMIVPQNESEKTQDTIDDVEMDITPIVGYFVGAANRTAGDDRSLYPRYPQLVFQDAAKGINLGFGDINGSTTIPGLRQYYEDNISVYNAGRRITVYIKLAPQDVEAILIPNEQKRDFRAVFLLSMNGEHVPCLLEQISDYNPTSGASTKCQFIVDPNLKLTGADPVVITYEDWAAFTRNDVVATYDGEHAD